MDARLFIYLEIRGCETMDFISFLYNIHEESSRVVIKLAIAHSIRLWTNTKIAYYMNPIYLALIYVGY